MTSPLKIAVLDDYQGISVPIFATLDPATHEVVQIKDTLLSYAHPDTPQEEKDKLVKRLEPFPVICTMRERTPFPAALIARLPNLRLLLTTGNRNLALDLPAFTARGIPVAGAHDKDRPAGTVGTDSTTEHCIALIMGAARGLAIDDAEVKAGGWQTIDAMPLSGRTLGVVGLGRLGLAVARIMNVAFRMRVVAWSENLTQEAADKKAAEAGLPVEGPDGVKTFRVVSKEELFRTADVVSLHLVLSERSRGVIARKDLEMMKRDAIFVNTSRGPLVVEEDLLGVLEEGRIRAAAVDVFEIEPLPEESRWRTTKWGTEGRSQVLLTPHMGYVTRSTIEGWYQSQVENLLKWEKGEELELRLC